MVPTQADTASLIARAAEAGVDIFLLSARDPSLFDATRRELARSGIHYPALHVCAFYLCSESGRYDDRQIKAALSVLGLPAEAGSYRPILIREGMVLSAGQDKGAILSLLLGAIGGRPYNQVLFVDDGRPNIDAVVRASYAVPVKAYHYTRWNRAITAADAKASQREFLQIRQVVCKMIAADIC
jgi:hypothetical protein